MEPGRKILRTLHSLPEATRKFLAILLVAFAASALFISWGKITASRLTVISPGNDNGAFIPTLTENPASPSPLETPEAASPAAGIIDSIRSLKRIWKGFQ